MTKPTYEELLEALFGVTQALRNTLLHACNMTDAEKDQRWTSQASGEPPVAAVASRANKRIRGF